MSELFKDLKKEIELENILEIISSFTFSQKVKKMISEKAAMQKDRIFEDHNIQRSLLADHQLPPVVFIPNNHEIFLKHIEIKNAYLSIEQLVQIYSAEYQIGNIISYLKGRGILDKFSFSVNTKILRKIERNINISDLSIRKDANKTISQLYQKLYSLEGSMKKRVNEIMDKYGRSGYLQDNFYTVKDGRFVLPIISSHKNKIQGIIHTISDTGLTTYIEPIELVYDANRLIELEKQINIEIIKVLIEITDTIRENIETINKNLRELERCEYYFTLIRFARQYKYCIPDHGKRLKINSGRHPLIEDDKVIPFDLDMQGFDLLMITGPNTGGKTILLKAVSLIVALYRLGFPVPAKEGTIIPFYKKIFVDIADTQSVQSSLSTFSGHLVKIKDIIDNSSKNDIVILDEPGTGTEAHLSDSFSKAIIDVLLKNEVTVLMTTHSKAVKEYISDRKNTLIASMVFDIENMMPTYHIVYGIPGESYAIEMASRYGLSDDFIQNVRSHTADGYFDYQKSRLEIDKLLLELTKQKAEIDLMIKKNADLKDEYLKKMKTIERDFKNEFHDKYKKLMLDYEELKKMTASLKKIEREKISKKIDENLKTIKESVERKDHTDQELIAPGMMAKLHNTSDYYEIISVKDDILELQIGDILTELPKEMVEDVKESEGNEKLSSGYKMGAFSNKIDIRGKIVEDAVYDVEKLLNNAYVSGVDTVIILHGTGSGKLKEGIRYHLSNHPLVKNFYDAVNGERINAGITYVEIKT